MLGETLTNSPSAACRRFCSLSLSTESGSPRASGHTSAAREPQPGFVTLTEDASLVGSVGSLSADCP